MPPAGEDQLTLSDGGGTTETTTIIPANGKLENGNGLHKQKLDNNGSAVPNDKELEIVAVEDGKLVIDEKSSGVATDFDDEDTFCGWGPFRPKWMQRFATKQMFLVIFCMTWVSGIFL